MFDSQARNHIRRAPTHTTAPALRENSFNLFPSRMAGLGPTPESLDPRRPPSTLVQPGPDRARQPIQEGWLRPSASGQEIRRKRGSDPRRTWSEQCDSRPGHTHARRAAPQGLGFNYKPVLRTAEKIAGRIAGTRKTKVAWQVIQQTACVPCSTKHSVRLKQAVKKFKRMVAALPSGAGHDAAVMAQITPAAMLFVRCKGGVSHGLGMSGLVSDQAMTWLLR